MVCAIKGCKICLTLPRRSRPLALKFGTVVCAAYTPTEIAALVRAAEYGMLPR